MADHGEIKLRDLKIKNLIDLYHAAYKNIVETIINDTTAGKIVKARTLNTIKAQLQELGDNVDQWVKSEIPQYYLDGSNQAIQDLRAMGVDLSGPKGLVAINKEAIASLVDATNTAFAQSLTAVQRNAAALVSDALKQQLNYIIADGQLTGAARNTVANSIKQAIQDDGISALTDAGGKNWTFDNYAQMLVRTKAVEARNAGLNQKMLQNGYDLVQVSNHLSSHAECAEWEGAILSITGNTPGYQTTDEAEAGGLMHPNCQHAYNPIDPDIADLTSAYDDPFNYEAAAADDGDIPDARSTGKVTEDTVYHGSGKLSVPAGNNMFGDAFYVSRDQDTASQFGSRIASSTLAVKPGEILTINSQEEYNNFVQKAVQWYSPQKQGDNWAQQAFPAYAKSLGYKAVEASADFDPLGGIAILDKSILKSS